MAEKEPVRYENTAEGLIQVNLGYLSDQLQVPLDIGPMEKDAEGHWIVPLSTPRGLSPELSAEQFEETLRELAHRLSDDYQIEVRYVFPGRELNPVVAEAPG